MRISTRINLSGLDLEFKEVLRPVSTPAQVPPPVYLENRKKKKKRTWAVLKTEIWTFLFLYRGGHNRSGEKSNTANRTLRKNETKKNSRWKKNEDSDS